MTVPLLGALVNAASVLAVSPLLDGVSRKLTAWIHSRKGPPLVQGYLDILKLLGKEDIETGVAPCLQRGAAVLALGSVLAASCLVPMGVGVPLERWGDGLVLLYVLALCGAATAFAGLAAGSPYSILGTSREVMSMIFLEPLCAIAILVGASNTQTLELSVLLNGSVYAHGGSPSALVLLAVVAMAFQAYVQKQPFDITEAETELMGGPLVDYSGPKLALFRLAHAAKLPVYGSIVIGLFAPWGADLPAYAAWPIHWLKLLALGVLTVLGATLHARIRTDQALRTYAVLYGCALFALLLATVGY